MNITTTIITAVLTLCLLVSCSSDNSKGKGVEERSISACRDVIDREFEPVYRAANPADITRDLDSDGVPDVTEVDVLKTDPCVKNTASGSGTNNQAPAAKQLAACRAVINREFDANYRATKGVNAKRDLDSDGVSDLAEIDILKTDPCVADNDNSAETALKICRAVVKYEFSPVYLASNPVDEKRDLDRDGVPDAVELLQKPETDACLADSDGDGLTDYHEGVISKKIAPKLGNINIDIDCKGYFDNCDADQDGVSDFKETHGYYYNVADSRFDSAKRLLTDEEWTALAQTDMDLADGQLNPWQVAMEALQYAGYKNYVTVTAADGTEKNYIALDVEVSRKAIIQAFLGVYANKDNSYLRGGSKVKGSVANIVNTLIAKMPYEKDEQGNPIDIYYTDSTLYSTDLDPMSDADEVSRVNLLPDVIHPADHPLVSGYPRIQAIIKRIDIQPNGKITDSKGQSVEDKWSIETTNTTRKTHGWSIGGNVGGSGGLEKGYTTKLFSPSVGAGYSNTTTNINSTSEKKGGSKSVDFRNALSYDKTCAAKAWFTVVFKNVGTATIYDLQPAFNLHIGENVYTFSPNSKNRIEFTVDHLSPGAETKQINYPHTGEDGQGRGSDLCLTINDLAYIEDEGGQIVIDMIPNKGKIAFWDKSKGNDKNLISTKGKWTNYQTAIHSAGAAIDYILVDENNKVHQGNFVNYAGNAPATTLGDALKHMITNKARTKGGRRDIALPVCKSDSQPQKACIDSRGQIQLGQALNTFVAVHAFDDKNQPIPADGIEDSFKAILANGNIMNLPLIPHWRYELISHESARLPKGSGARVDATPNTYHVSGWAADDYGSDVNAQFCKSGYSGNQDSGDCDDMTRATLAYGAMMRFSYTLPINYVFTGEEHMLLTNANGSRKVALESVDVTQVGFKLLGETNDLINYYNGILNRLDEYSQHVDTAILTRLGNEMRITNHLSQYKQGVLAKKGEVQALVAYCANTNAKHITDVEKLKIYARKCTGAQEITLLEQKKAAIEGKTVLPEWTKLVSKVSVNLYTRNKNDFTFWQARRDMETDAEEPSDYEYFTVGVSCGVPSNRVITRVRVDAGYKGHTKGSNRVRRSSSHLREIHFDSYTINPHTYAFENKRSHRCQTNDRRAFWRTEVNDGNFHSETQSVNPNNREYITAVGLSLDDAHVRLCVKYASIDAISGQTTYRTSKGSRCSSAEKTSWSWSRQGGKPTLALIGLKIGNGYGNRNKAKIDRNNVRHLASSYSKVNTAIADIYNQPTNPALIKNEQLRQLSTRLVQWTNQQNAISPSKMPVNRLDDPSLVVGKTLDGFQLGLLVCPKLREFLQKSQNQVFANLMNSQKVHPAQARQWAFDSWRGWRNKVKAAAVEWTKNPSPTADYLSKNPIKVDELNKINVSACGFLGKAWQHYYTEIKK